tara:strand:+ start:399 stop:695 length:297 start_codon:yes stop_codon:yes gene_type:complete
MAILTFPANPIEDQPWVGENKVVYVYRNGRWTSAGALAEQPPSDVVATVGPAAPDNPLEGNLWFNTNAGILYVWYQDEDQQGDEGQWTDVRPPETATD